MAADFKEHGGVSAPVYTDPSRQTYAALGAKRGLAAMFHPLAALAGLRSLASGHKQTGTAGDPLQQGGELVVQPDGRVLFLHLAGFAGDHAQVADVLAVLPER